MTKKLDETKQRKMLEAENEKRRLENEARAQELQKQQFEMSTQQLGISCSLCCFM